MGDGPRRHTLAPGSGREPTGLACKVWVEDGDGV